MHGTYFIAYFDGSAIPNPGEMQIGGYIKDELGNIFHSFSEKLGHGTNNQAEYRALYKTLQLLYFEVKATKIQVIGDSKLVVAQVNSMFGRYAYGKYKIKNQQLKEIAIEIKNLLKLFDKWELDWVERSKNKEADLLTRTSKGDF